MNKKQKTIPDKSLRPRAYGMEWLYSHRAANGSLAARMRVRFVLQDGTTYVKRVTLRFWDEERLDDGEETEPV